MPLKRPGLLLLLLAACAHAPSRTDTTRTDTTRADATRATADSEPAPRPPEPEPRAQPRPAPAGVDFTRDVRPILEARCTPCHFEGGRMYDKLPFDRAATIRALGTRLFTRIKAADEKAMIERFLAQSP